MLVLCNGAYKSGSTWLFNIVAQLTAFEFPPPSYRNRKWRNPSIDPARLVDFLRSVDFRTRNFVSKQHIGEQRPRDLVLATEDVLVLDIDRDLRDVIVSAYYHHRRDGRFVGSIADFYRTEGRLIAHQVSRYTSSGVAAATRCWSRHTRPCMSISRPKSGGLRLFSACRRRPP
jgi:hypothetical protein